MDSAETIFRDEINKIEENMPEVSDADASHPMTREEWDKKYNFLRNWYGVNKESSDAALLTFTQLLNEILTDAALDGERLEKYLQVREIAFRRLAIRLVLSNIISYPPSGVEIFPVEGLESLRELADMIENFEIADNYIMRAVVAHFQASKES